MIILLVASYFLGSIPFGFLVVHLVKKVDIRKVGSGNIGATNVYRVLGKKWAIAVFVLDFLKGFIALFIASSIDGLPNYMYILTAVCVVCGHNWTIFLNFKGGKGVATSVGAIVGLSLVFPVLFVALFLSLTVWIILFSILKYVSIASLAAALCFFLFSLFFVSVWEIKVFAFALFVFIVARHKENIKNLIAKRELRF
ncbi:MAG: glycerol-3-phosphate 1-O-acyltransferase PlsY [Candidatus Omnitrophica bacterium]|nr:glycerol-3-phosphate 1-O-acyltransferase PlsY [Candidatus Omnitrophota bacterium]